VLQVIRMLGNGRLEGHCFDGQTRLCHIRGKMRKKVWVSVPAYNPCACSNSFVNLLSPWPLISSLVCSSLGVHVLLE
jgi:hypothetical protein